VKAFLCKGLNFDEHDDKECVFFRPLKMAHRLLVRVILLPPQSRSGSSLLRVSVSVRVVHVIDAAHAIFLFCSVRWYFQLVSSSERGRFTIRSQCARMQAWLVRTISA